MMKYILTESQDDYLNKWKQFETFMKRRDRQIMEIINSVHEHKKDFDSHSLITDFISNEFINVNELHNSQFEDWVHHFIADNYGEIIKQKIQS